MTMCHVITEEQMECAEFARQNARVDAIRARRKREQERREWAAERKRHAQEMRLMSLSFAALAVFTVGAALIIAGAVV